jgi:hypothetical protein
MSRVAFTDSDLNKRHPRVARTDIYTEVYSVVFCQQPTIVLQTLDDVANLYSPYFAGAKK